MTGENDAVQHLISVEKRMTAGTPAHLAALEALGEAGGAAARTHLISVEKRMTAGTPAHMAAVKALGRATR
ncbi:TPA: hypothetical protein NIF12_006577, partial [Pseudomonas aeruginosa]|nr:hypothetical protein [Pseudomonas aeruginosa]